MFNFLEDIPAEEAITSVYYAIRLISHRQLIMDLSIGLKVEGVESEPSSNDEQHALLIVDGIEKIEGRPLRDIGDSSAEDYIRELADIAHTRAVEAFGSDIQMGRELLAQLEPGISQPV